jgi:hypothetical protein
MSLILIGLYSNFYRNIILMRDVNLAGRIYSFLQTRHCQIEFISRYIHV